MQYIQLRYLSFWLQLFVRSVLRADGSPFENELGEAESSESNERRSRLGLAAAPLTGRLSDGWEKWRDAEAGVGRLATSLLELELRAGGASEKLIDAVHSDLSSEYLQYSVEYSE